MSLCSGGHNFERYFDTVRVFPFMNVWFSATDELLLLLHGHDLLCLLPDVGSGRLPCQSYLCKAHLQVRLVSHALLHDTLLGTCL